MSSETDSDGVALVRLGYVAACMAGCFYFAREAWGSSVAWFVLFADWSLYQTAMAAAREARGE